MAISENIIRGWYNIPDGVQATPVNTVSVVYNDLSTLFNPSGYFHNSRCVVKAYRSGQPEYIRRGGSSVDMINTLNSQTSWDYAVCGMGFTSSYNYVQQFQVDIYIYPSLFTSYTGLDFYLALSATAGGGLYFEVTSFDTTNFQEYYVSGNHCIQFIDSNYNGRIYGFSPFAGDYPRNFVELHNYNYPVIGLNDDDVDGETVEGVAKVDIQHSPYDYNVNTANVPIYRYSVFFNHADDLSGDYDFDFSVGIYGYPSLHGGSYTSKNTQDVFDIIRTGFESATSFFSYEIVEGITVGGLVAIPLVLSILLTALKLMRK